MLSSEVSSMYSRILFAIDDDEALAGAVPVVAAYARRWGAAVRVLHLHRVDSRPTTADDGRLVQSVVDCLRSEGVDAMGTIRLVEASERIGPLVATIATAQEVDLVAIGAHGRSDLGALFLGSVSHDAAIRLTMPVLVLRAGLAFQARPGTVLVGVDGSPASDEAVTEAADIAGSFGAQVVVVHVSQVIAAEGVAIAEPDDEARSIVQRAVASVKARGVAATGVTAVDHSAANGVVSAAKRHRAELVVLGSRRPSHIDGLVLGSVAHEAIHRLRCPVLLGRRVRSAEPVG
jgi:nucleotide-binding universal stress UspA family protein